MKSTPGASAAFEEMIAARMLLISVNQDALWNPWVRDDRETELAIAMDVIAQWTRAEPGFRQWTAEETEAWLEEGRLRREAQRAQVEARWERDRARFDSDLFATRRALLEQESILPHVRQELAEYESGRRFLAMSATKRQLEITELRGRVDHCEREIARLRGIVGDPESVVNELGQLPRDRRESNLFRFKFDRERAVRDLLTRIPDLRSRLKATSGREERKKARDNLSHAEADLTHLLAMSPLTKDEMCSECPTPLSGHGWVSLGLHGARPCPARPGWAARVHKAHEMLFAAAESAKEPTVERTALKPQPLAVLASGLNILM